MGAVSYGLTDFQAIATDAALWASGGVAAASGVGTNVFITAVRHGQHGLRGRHARSLIALH